MAKQVIRTPAWLLVGLTRSTPGVLEFADERLGFTTENGRLFHVPLTELTDLKFPWYYFGGGVKFTVGAERYRLSFVRPNDADDVPERLLSRRQDRKGGALLAAGLLDIGEGRRAGRAWKSVLTSVATGSAR